MGALFRMFGLHALVADERDRDVLEDQAPQVVAQLEHLAVMVACAARETAAW